MNEYCFLPGQAKLCSSSCMAYIKDVPEPKTNCRLINAIEKLVPIPTRPTAPPPPKVTR